jgi:hypothetical protein
MMEHYQLTDHLDPSLKPENQSKTNKDESDKLMEKPNDKKHKAKPKKDDSDLPGFKKACKLHGPIAPIKLMTAKLCRNKLVE